MGLEIGGRMDFREAMNVRKQSEKYKYFSLGDAYYLARNTNIFERKKNIFLEGIGVVENPFGANHKLASGHFKKIVDQKVMYLLGKGVHFPEEQDLDQYFEDTFDETMIDMGIEASKKCEAWLYAYKMDGQLRFTMIPAEQLTPMFDEYGSLKQMVRSYQADGFKWAYVYTPDELIIYRQRLDETDYQLYQRVGHWTDFKMFNGEIVDRQENSFGRVPFIPLYNNREHLSDLYNIKQLIDTYDIISSDFANNIDDMQDAYFTLKGYTGDGRNLAEFMRQLKLYKAVPVGDDGDVSSHQLEIPTEARKVFLERIEKDIYKFAMAVDLSTFNGGSITNVYIKAMFADLDLKTNQFESEVRKFIKRLVEFINDDQGTSYTYDCNFFRETIMNGGEVVDNLVKLSGIISNKTIRELQPYDIDVEEEEKRIAEQVGDISLMEE